MLLMLKRGAFALLLLSFLASCTEKTELLPLDADYAYFPAEEGFWVEYQIDTLQKDKGFDDKFISREVREVVGSSYTDGEGETAYRLLRYVRNTGSNTPWSSIVPQVQSIRRTTATAERNDNNMRFIKLAFPLANYKNWSGNAYIDEEYYIDDNKCNQVAFYKNWDYHIEKLHQKDTINEMIFDSTLTVVQQQYENFLQYTYSHEVYAKGVGLVYKSLQDLNVRSASAPPLSESPWPGRANCGNIITWKILDYKK